MLTFTVLDMDFRPCLSNIFGKLFQDVNTLHELVENVVRHHKTVFDCQAYHTFRHDKNGQEVAFLNTVQLMAAAPLLDVSFVFGP